MDNQECKIRSEIINVNTNEPIFYPYSITINKCKGSCNTINDLYAKTCVPDAIKNKSFKVFKGALSGQRQFLATEIPLKMMKNDFYFTSKALSVLKIFKFLSWLFDHEVKRLEKKDKVNFNFFDVIAWLTNNCNTHIAQYIDKLKQSDNEIRSVNRM